ncbi:proline-rich protein 36-like isoform X2 [Lutra lutra]|uniref:proline-rich protein 36-like isoform X2 n=1 Tax=Lutra lutra TaxID=9657 RepID=UPI001FD23013|nr:proline-rich protein 36-like isoform X2 [Lutra lutra]
MGAAPLNPEFSVWKAAGLHMLISSHRLMQKEPWTRNKEQSSDICGSPEAALDTWPGREPPADGEFLVPGSLAGGADVGLRRGLCEPLRSPSFRRSRSQQRGNGGRTALSTAAGRLTVESGPEPRSISKASSVDRTSTHSGTRNHPLPAARGSGTSGAKIFRPTAQTPGEQAAEGHCRNREPTTQSAPALHKASPAPRAPPPNPLPTPLPSSARPLPPASRPAPFSRLVQGMDATSDWPRRSHEGAVVAFPEAITGQAQSFASVSSSS